MVKIIKKVIILLIMLVILCPLMSTTFATDSSENEKATKFFTCAEKFN